MEPAPGEASHQVSAASGPFDILYVTTLLVGLHSIVLGAWIYVYTNKFYGLFFSSSAEDLFFVRQAGLFLVCLGLFYLCPLVNLRKYHRLVVLIIVTKILAVVFMIWNAGFTSAPDTIRLTAIGDGSMALLLIFCYAVYRARRLD